MSKNSEIVKGPGNTGTGGKGRDAMVGGLHGKSDELGRGAEVKRAIY